MGPLARAFDAVAESYDLDFGRNPVGLLFRHAVQERLARLFPPGARVLDLGCGTGEDAVFLASRGVAVHAIDVSPRMVEACRAKAAARGLGSDRVAVERRAAEDVEAAPGSPFDGAYSDFGALNCVDLGAVARGLARVLRAGAPLLAAVMGPRPLPALLQRALTGRGERRDGSARVGGIALAVHHPGVAELRRALEPAFEWRRCFALGALVPGPSHGAWAGRHPQAFGLLAALERVVRGWPVVRGLGDHLVVEAVRRPERRAA